MSDQRATSGLTIQDSQGFYRRPIVPFLEPRTSSLGTSSLLEIGIIEEAMKNLRRGSNESLPRTERIHNKGTQTDYRESECQTLPWEPPYKIPEGRHFCAYVFNTEY